jgi:molybdopterin molybdotransferase
MSSGPTGAQFEVRSADWLGVFEAQERILSGSRPLGVQTVALSDALGRALAEDLSATATLPPWDNSAMDGYAVRADDVQDASASNPTALLVVGRVHAGEAPGAEVAQGQATRIMTGAPLPPGADTVVRVEDTDSEATPGRVDIHVAPARGKHVRPAGEDMKTGQSMLLAGQTITPGAIAILAAMGLDRVPTVRPPVVAILTTGDELRTPDRYDEVRAGAGVPESNGPMIAAMVTQAGGEAVSLGIGADDRVDLAERIGAGAGADVLITVGGASMGEADLVKRVLDELGFQQDFWRVRMRPGSPFGFGRLPRGETLQPVLGLPGNPTSAFVTFEVFVRPLLLSLAGHSRRHRRVVRAVAAEPLRAPANLTFLLRVSLDTSADVPTVRLAGAQGSGLVKGLAGADGLAIVPEDVHDVMEGDEVSVMLLDNAPASVSSTWT